MKKPYRHSLGATLRLNLASTVRLFSTLRRAKMGLLIPLVVVLLSLSIVIYLANVITPLAPFIYSLI